MPRGDGTGPLGQGPYTGRNFKGQLSPNRNGFRNFGRGLGRGNGVCYTINRTDESLIQEKNSLENRIKDIDSQLKTK